MMEWVNPHSWLHIDVKKPDGSIERWKIEGGSPSVLMRLGWDRNSLPAGTRVTVVGFQAKDGSLRASSRDLKFPEMENRDMHSGSIGWPVRKDRPYIAVIAMVASLTLPVSAHHSFSAEFDANKVVTLDGQVVMMEWVNSHSWLHIDVKKPDCSVEWWKIEGSYTFRIDASRLESEFAARRHQGHRRRLPGEGRIAARQFAGPQIPRRPAHESRRLGIQYAEVAPSSSFFVLHSSFFVLRP